MRFLAPSADVANLQRRMNAGEINVGIIMPRDFERRRLERDRAAVQLLVDGSEPMTDERRARRSPTTPLPRAQRHLRVARQPLFEVRTEYNPERRTAVQIVPALIGVILNMTMVIFTAVAIVRERERGNLELLITTPVRSGELMAGKLIPYVFIGLIQTTLILVVGSLLFDVPVNGSLLGPVPGRGAVHRGDADARTADLDRDADAVPGVPARVLDDAAVDPAVGVHVPVRRHAEAIAVVRAGAAAHAFRRDDPRHRAARRADHGPVACRPRSSPCSWWWRSRSPRCASASGWTDGWQGWQAATPAQTGDERAVTRAVRRRRRAACAISPMHARACSSSARCPGQASLAARQYYAQPQNAFWRVIEDLYGVPRTLPYAQRVAALLEHGIGMWDVCASAHRPGSLDSSIARESIVANDFARLYRRCPGIELVCFNGATAAALYRRLVLPTLDAAATQLRYVVLPSTSPAHASMRYAEKLERWRAVTTAAAARRKT